MMQDEQLIKKRFLDLFQQAQRKGIVCFSDFLTLNEQNILNSCAGSLGITYELSGGCFYAERQIAAFLPDALYYEWSYPIKCIEIAPAYPKFADTISHRDVLGARRGMEDQTHPSGLYVRKGMPFGAPFLVDETELNESGKGNCRLHSRGTSTGMSYYSTLCFRRTISYGSGARIKRIRKNCGIESLR